HRRLRRPGQTLPRLSASSPAGPVKTGHVPGGAGERRQPVPMFATMSESLFPPSLAGQPVETIERDGVRYTLLGTAHVSHASVEAVRAAIASGQFDAVAVELCESRQQAMLEPERLQQLDLLRVLREGKVGMVAAQLLLASYQSRLAEQLGIEP